MRGCWCKCGSFSWIRYQRPKLGASRGPLFTISRGGREGEAEEVHHPFQDISSPTHPANSVYRNFHSDPTHLQEGQPDKAGNAKFILISLLACKLCPGSPPITPLAVPIPFLPRPLATLAVASHHQLVILCGIWCTNCKCTAAGRQGGQMTMQIFMSFPGTTGSAKMSALRKSHFSFNQKIMGY